jgi:hypothetical protein
MRAPSKARSALALVIALGLPMLGCKKDASDRTTSAHPGGQTERDSDPLARLASLEHEMQRLGLPVALVKSATLETGEGHDGDATLGAEGEAVEERPEAEDMAATEPQAAPNEVAAGQAPSRREQAEYCSNVCDLSQAICELEGQICSLSENHGDDPIYTDACRRAGDDCDTADAECDRCAG